MKKEECYELLKIKVEATPEEIQKAFDLAVKEYRARERASPSQTEREFEKIVAAYRLLIRERNRDSSSGSSISENGGGREDVLKHQPVSEVYSKGAGHEKGIQRGIAENMTDEIDKHLVAFLEPRSPASEQYRVLFTRTQQLLGNALHKLLAISSSVKGEGKTVTSLNLATVIARDFGRRTLLLDGDLKKPDIHSYLRRAGKMGLVDVLLGKATLEDCMVPFLFEDLFVLPAGTRCENSLKFLSMPKMGEILAQLAKEFDYVIIDTPPVLPLADMNIFSNLVDGILLVVRAGKTSRDVVKKVLESLPSQKVLGVILNDMEVNFKKHYTAPY